MADLVFIIIFIIALMVGYQVGFLRAVINFVGIFVSAIGGFLLYPFVTPILMKTPIYDFVNKVVVNYLKIHYTANIEQNSISAMFTKYATSTIEGLNNNMATGITIVIMNIISLIIIIIGIRIIIGILKTMCGILNKIPIIGTFNKVLGMIVSGCSCIILMFVIVAVMLLPPSNKSEISTKMCSEIDKSVIVSRAMDYNIFISYKSLANTN